MQPYLTATPDASPASSTTPSTTTSVQEDDIVADTTRSTGSPKALLLTHALAWLVFLGATIAPAGLLPSILVLGYALLFPGDALRAVLRVRADEIHLRALLALAGSVTILMAVGAASTAVFQLFALDAAHALDRGALVAGVSAVHLLCLLVVAAVKHYHTAAVPDMRHWLAWGVAALLALFVFVGARVIDGTGNPTVSAVALGLLGLAVAVATVADGPAVRALRPTILAAFTIGVAWSFSQRTPYLFGYDIHQEYGWALHTAQAGHWVHTLGDAYGAMLGVTVLPVVTTTLAGVELTQWFKSIGPLALGAYIMGIHLFIRRFVPDRWALVATTVLALIPQSLWQLPGVSRQAVALLLFAAIALLLFRDGSSRRGDVALASIVSASLAVTHYTTAYITLALFVGGFVLAFIARRVFGSLRHQPRYLAIPVLIAMLVATVGWNVVYTQSSGNVETVSEEATTEGGLDQREGGLLASFLDGINVAEGTPQQYFEETRVQSEERIWKQIYAKEAGDRFAAQAEHRPIPEQYGPLAALAPVSEAGFVVLRQIVNLAAALGTLLLVLAVWQRSRHRRSDAGRRSWLTHRVAAAEETSPRSAPLDLACVSLVALAATGLTRFNASLAQAYNPERLLMQTGLILGVGVALLAHVLLSSKRGRTAALVVPVVAVLLTGATVFDATGLRALAIVRDAGNLMRDGEHSARYEITDADHAAVMWLSGHYRYDDMVFTDAYGVLLTHEHPKFERGMIAELSPYTLDQRGFVLATEQNVVDGIARVSSEGVRTSFTYPRDFMSTYKSRVYSNGNAEVYR